MKSNTYLFIAAVTIAISGCKKESSTPAPSPNPATYQVRLTDAPGPYTAVNIDIQGVEITSNNGVANLNVNPGIYNLLDFTNGNDTLIATGSVTAGKIQQVRLILGPNNSLVDSNGTYPLEIPSSAQSGLKINVHTDVSPGVAYELLLDFDANQSIIKEGNGSYKLKPVIRAVDKALGGAIKGTVVPTGVMCAVTATNASGGYSSAVDTITGGYLIQGVPAGTYTLQFTPASPYSVTAVSPVQVNTGATTSVAPHNL